MLVDLVSNEKFKFWYLYFLIVSVMVILLIEQRSRHKLIKVVAHNADVCNDRFQYYDEFILEHDKRITELEKKVKQLRPPATKTRRKTA